SSFACAMGILVGCRDCQCHQVRTRFLSQHHKRFPRYVPNLEIGVDVGGLGHSEAFQLFTEQCNDLESPTAEEDSSRGMRTDNVAVKSTYGGMPGVRCCLLALGKELVTPYEFI